MFQDQVLMETLIISTKQANMSVLSTRILEQPLFLQLDQADSPPL